MKNLRDCLKEAKQSLKNFNTDWYAVISLYDNGSVAYQLRANGYHFPYPQNYFGDVNGATLLGQERMTKYNTVKDTIEKINEHFQWI